MPRASLEVSPSLSKVSGIALSVDAVDLCAAILSASDLAFYYCTFISLLHCNFSVVHCHQQIRVLHLFHARTPLSLSLCVFESTYATVPIEDRGQLAWVLCLPISKLLLP